MTKALICLLSLFFSASLLAQKTFHDPNIELRNLSGFHSIEVSGGIDLYISQGEETVAVSAREKSRVSRIKTEVKDGVLKIYHEWKDGLKISIGKGEEYRAYVSVKDLKKLVASGGVDVSIEGELKGKALEIEISGGADLKGKLNVEDLRIGLSGGTDVTLSGIATHLVVQASGASDFDAYDLTTQVCYAEASGASDISITVHKELMAEASGASEVEWKGQAAIKKINATGASSISHRS